MGKLMGKLVFIDEDRQKKKKMMIVGGALFCTAILIGIILLWPGGRGYDDDHRRVSPATVSVNVPLRGEKGGAATFLLQPDPAELMADIAEASKAALPLDLTKYQNARVLWPVYFFKIREMNDAAALAIFDSCADGFGVSVQGEIDSAALPEIKQLRPGQKVWLAGRIVAADAAGTGTVRLKAEYCNTDGDTPLDAVVRDMAAR